MNKIRSLFPILETKINDRPLVYFDNAATTQKPQVMIDALVDFYQKHNSNIHRGLNPLADRATEMHEATREKVAKFINAKNKKEIVFTRNTTESINLVAKTYGQHFLKAGDKVVLSILEHHSNIVPWLQLKKEIGIELVFITLDPEGNLDLKQAKELISQAGVKFLSLQMASNTLGNVHEISDLIKLAQSKGIKVLLDAAQVIAHQKIDVQNLGANFVAFSAHKMFGPTGVGVLYAGEELLKEMPEFLGGGDMIADVFLDHFTLNELPHKFEAGTPNIADVVAYGATIDFVNDFGLDQIAKIEKELTEYLLQQLQNLDFVEIYGPQIVENHLSSLAFNLKNVHAHDVGDLLGEAGIILRAGQHCTQPLHDFLQVPATVRASLAFYNTKEEIDIFIRELEKINQKFI
ncbi:SufS family cysteine desulfurase [Candidatus Nomurabacteria bacterium]|nr:SufS family cysteine desulfurase [Candidatus Nomurabacteria bacterium]